MFSSTDVFNSIFPLLLVEPSGAEPRLLMKKSTVTPEALLVLGIVLEGSSPVPASAWLTVVGGGVMNDNSKAHG